MDADKVAAYTTMFEVLSKLTRVIAPYVPFVAESIYQNIERPFFADAKESIHLCDFPKVVGKYINKEIEDSMNLVLDIVVLARAARNKANIKNRQPIKKLIYTTEKELTGDFLYLVKDEINVKEVEINRNASEFVSYELKPQLKTLGPKYGKLLGQIRNELATKTNEIMNAINSGKEYKFNVNGEEITLYKDDLLIYMNNKEGFASESSAQMTVVLDTKLTKELIEEGIEREFISKVQSMRKEAGFEVTDHISIAYRASGEVEEVLKKNNFMKDVLCDRVENDMKGFNKIFDINGVETEVSIKKI